MAVADLFHNDGYKYLAYADRLTGWAELAYFQKDPTSSEINNAFREVFQRYGVPEELSLDGGPNISSTEVKDFLKSWGTNIRLSSAYYPKSNGRAELAVKTCKRLIDGNTGRNGILKTDRVARALLQYRNTPLKVGNKSPAQLLFGRSLRDSIPQSLSSHMVSQHWNSYLRQREKEMHDNLNKLKKYHDKNVKEHEVLPVGTTVVCQNNESKKWDRTGCIVECLKFRQYLVRMDGSGRVSLRNRVHLRPTLIKPHMIVQKTQSRPVEPAVPTHSTMSSSKESTSQSTANSSPSSRDTYQAPSPIVAQRVPARRRRQPIRYGEWIM